MEKYITSELEKRLAAFDDVSPILNDTQLKAALNKIIEETEPKTDADVALIDEAVEMLLELENVDVDELEQSSKAWGEKYKKEHKFSAVIKAKKNRKSIKIKWLMPVAALLSILCITALVSCTAVFDVWEITKEVYCNLIEKVEHLIDGSSVISTTDYDEYKSLDELIETENLSGVLLPTELPNEYSIDNLSYNDLGDIQSITMDVLKNGSKIGIVDISLSFQANFDKDKLSEIGEYLGYECEYDNIFQFQFDNGNNHYIINAHQYADMVKIIDSMKET